MKKIARSELEDQWYDEATGQDRRDEFDRGANIKGGPGYEFPNATQTAAQVLPRKRDEFPPGHARLPKLPGGSKYNTFWVIIVVASSLTNGGPQAGS